LEEGEARESVLSKSLSCNLLTLRRRIAQVWSRERKSRRYYGWISTKRAVPQFCSGQKVYATDFFNTLLANAGSGETSGGLENSKAPSSKEDHFRLTMSRK
jgi:hypothetical protein